jgi:hypothetical protein
VELAREVAGVALLGGHPQVRRARVKHDVERLRGRANGDGAVVLRVLEVGDLDLEREQ